MFVAGVSETHGRCRLARVRQTRFLASICCTGSDASIPFPIRVRSEFLHVSVALRISPLERFSGLRWRQGDSTVCYDYVRTVTALFCLSKLKDFEKICAAHLNTYTSRRYVLRIWICVNIAYIYMHVYIYMHNISLQALARQVYVNIVSTGSKFQLKT